MNTNIQLRSLVVGTPDFDAAEKLYVDSFPPAERRMVDDWRRLVEGAVPAFRALSIVSSDADFLGFITCWDFRTFLYVEHFAVSPHSRGGGIGGKALDALLQMYGNRPFVLEVEPPVAEMAVRRIRFYERHGFVLSDLPYVQPCYAGNSGDGLPLNLMTTNGAFLYDNAAEVRGTIYREVYGVAAEPASCSAID